MNKKALLTILMIAMLFLASCGTYLKSDQAFKKHTDIIDKQILLMDSMFLLLFVVPGVVMLGVDYITGTLFLTEEQINSQQ